MKWQFYRQDPTDPILNPIAGEFFSSEAVGDAADALVREAIQNSLDARTNDSRARCVPARVRIFLSEDELALTAARADKWFGSIWPHVSAPRNGLVDKPTKKENCPFIVIEDFATTGLDGDPEAFSVDPESPNNFLNFFRAVGYSDKGTHAKGSWGVGKTVFPRSSRISSFIGYTVRASDERRMLLGRSILKYHSVGGRPFKSDGYYGRPRDDGFVLPIEELSVLTDFRKDFQLERHEEPGLSVVVPWYSTSGDNGITAGAMLRAVISGFFHPMLAGDLIVQIDTPGISTRLDADTVPDVLRSQSDSWAKEKLAVIELARWWRGRAGACDAELSAPAANRAQKWGPETVSAEVVRQLVPLAGTGDRFAVRVPMHVLPRDSDPMATHFDVVCEATGDDTATVMFIRDGLIISDVRPTKRTRGVRALVIVDQDSLAGFLRDAETPAHTEWTPSTANFRNKYKFGPGGIKYVRAAVPELFGALRSADTQPDMNLTLEHFSIERETPRPGRKKRKRPSVKVAAKPRRFRINKLEGGFSFRPPSAVELGDVHDEAADGAGDGREAPAAADFRQFAVRIKAAYDIRSGSAITSYSPFDFNVAKKPITVEHAGVEIRQQDGNQILAVVLEPEFHINVRGFDQNRDLFVDARILKERGDDDTQD
jgi:hypothetical protein